MSNLRAFASNVVDKEDGPLAGRVFDKRAIPDLGQGAFFFRLMGIDDASFHHVMKFWLTSATEKKDGKPSTFPVVSQMPFEAYVNKARNGSVFINKLIPEKGCKLSKLAANKHPLISINTFTPLTRKGEPNYSIDKIHAMKIQVVEPVKDAASSKVIVIDGAPQVKVLAPECVIELWQSVYEQLLDILEPPPEKQVKADATDVLTGAAEEKEPIHVIPTGAKVANLVFFIKKVTPPKDSKLQTEFVYKLDFSEKIVLQDDQIPKADPVLPPWSEIEPPITDDELNEMLAQWKSVGVDFTGFDGKDTTSAVPASAPGVGSVLGGPGATPAVAGKTLEDDPF